MQLNFLIPYIKTNLDYFLPAIQQKIEEIKNKAEKQMENNGKRPEINKSLSCRPSTNNLVSFTPNKQVRQKFFHIGNFSKCNFIIVIFLGPLTKPEEKINGVCYPVEKKTEIKEENKIHRIPEEKNQCQEIKEEKQEERGGPVAVPGNRGVETIKSTVEDFKGSNIEDQELHQIRIEIINGEDQKEEVKKDLSRIDGTIILNEENDKSVLKGKAPAVFVGDVSSISIKQAEKSSFVGEHFTFELP